MPQIHWNSPSLPPARQRARERQREKERGTHTLGQRGSVSTAHISLRLLLPQKSTAWPAIAQTNADPELQGGACRNLVCAYRVAVLVLARIQPRDKCRTGGGRPIGIDQRQQQDRTGSAGPPPRHLARLPTSPQLNRQGVLLINAIFGTFDPRTRLDWAGAGRPDSGREHI